MHTTEQIPVHILTDINDDVDDITGLAYTVGHDRLVIDSVSTAYMTPDRRAFTVRALADNFYLPGLPIGVGCIWPLGKENEQLEQYLRDHMVDGLNTEGIGLVECFPTAQDILRGAIRRHGDSLVVAALAPLTDLARFALQAPDDFKRIKRLYIQGQANIIGGKLVPSMESHNLRQDPLAADIVFGFQDDMPFTLLGKYAAYRAPLSRTHFRSFADTGTINGRALDLQARLGLLCSARNSPDIFRRIYGVEPHQLGQIDTISKPYDALTLRAIADLSGYELQRYGEHELIGMTPDQCGITAPGHVVSELAATVLKALSSSKLAA